MKRYWMVHNPSGQCPAFRHDTIESARKEAERLARKTGQTIVILEATIFCKPVNVPIEWAAVPYGASDEPLPGPETFDKEGMF